MSGLMHWRQARELVRERWRLRKGSAEREAHLAAALDWMRAAQDSSEDRGVAYGYMIDERWMRSYPETTGYIIPTLLNCSRILADENLRSRAIEMAEWELGCQLEGGAIANLTAGESTVFDTGQVIFGWIAAHRATQDPRFKEAARRGAEWLITELDDQGVWRHASDAGGPGRVYNVRVAWSLVELAAYLGEERYADAMRPFLDWTLEQERGGGWFDRNCLTDDKMPLLHTIAYTARGQLESGLRLGDRRYVEAAQRTASALTGKVRSNGFMPGRYDREWKPAANWACLTGMAQISIVWRRLAAASELPKADRHRFLDAAVRVGDFLRRSQDRTSANAGLRGGIRGSFPANGAYGHWKVLNWATKFFIDLLLLEDNPDALVERG